MRVLEFMGSRALRSLVWGLAFIGLFGVVLSVCKMQHDSEQQKIDDYVSNVDHRYVTFTNNVVAITKKYQGMISCPEIDNLFKKAEEGVDFVSGKEGLCGYKVLASLAYKIAYDKIRGTNLTEQAIQPIITAHVVEPLTNAVNVYERQLVKFSSELQSADQTFSHAFLMPSHGDYGTGPDFPVQTLATSGEEIVTVLPESLETASLAACVGASCVALRKAVVKASLKALSSVAKKMVTTTTVATTSAAADGPLPIGDIVGAVIEIGGLTWSAYEIYKVSEGMEKDLKQSGRKFVCDIRQELEIEMNKRLEGKSGELLKSAELRITRLKNDLTR